MASHVEFSKTSMTVTVVVLEIKIMIYIDRQLCEVITTPSAKNDQNSIGRSLELAF